MWPSGLTPQTLHLEVRGSSFARSVVSLDKELYSAASTVNLRNFAELCLRSLETYHFKFGNLTNFKSLFPVAVDGFSLTGPCKKLKNCGKIYWALGINLVDGTHCNIALVGRFSLLLAAGDVPRGNVSKRPPTAMSGE